MSRPEDFKPSNILGPLGVDVNDDTFCIMPFMHMSTTTNGEYRLCCRSQKVTEVNHNRIHELFPDRIKEPTENTTPRDIWQSNTYTKYLLIILFLILKFKTLIFLQKQLVI